jgi:GNAT superfamily N-acetyltransferase
MNIPTPHGTMTLRAETDHDGDFLFALFAGTKAPEMALMPVDDAIKAHLLQMQFRSMTMTYRQQFPAARFEIVELDATPVGRLITDVRADCVYYVDIALLPERRMGGLATALMQAVLEEPKQLGVPGRVQVLAANIASLRLCQKLGMTVRGQTPPFVELEWRPGA